MSSSILHQCPFCGHVSDISLALAAFIENPHCNQCGLSVSESNGKMQDELASLFERQMTMATAQTEVQPPVSYSASQHYHHSSHVVPPSPSDIATVLQQHGLDPGSLSPDQQNLFARADAEQQQRLIQTWQFYSRPSLANPTDDLEMDYSMNHGAEDQREQAEPYMLSGYETVAERSLRQEPTTGQPYASSTDPVYKTGHWWESASVGPMESQYGAFEERNRCFSGEGLPQQWLCPS